MHYLLPLKAAADADPSELAQYLHTLSESVDVIVVDGSDEPVFSRNAEAFGAAIRHLRPDADLACGNGKVAGVRTGFRRCERNKVIIADDDVRYTVDQLRRLERELDDVDLVRPQNYFCELPWHARMDTARTLLNRCFGADYPGTLAVRLNDQLRRDGYDGDVMFENLELIRTVRALGGTQRILLDLYVARRPPSARHFRGQRVRQAFDSWAQPVRFVAELSLLPGVVAALRSPRRFSLITFGTALSIAAAELGRRRAGGRAVFPADTAAWAPAWLVERACCAWIALALGLSGRGVRYGDGRLRVAAHSQRELNRRVRSRGQRRAAQSQRAA